MNKTYTLTVEDQILASSRWDLAAMTICSHCKECIRECHETLADGCWGTFDGADQLECGYECETRYKQRVTHLWHILMKDEGLLRKEFPVYARKLMFNNELRQLLCMLRGWDPNGDWDEWDVLVSPLQTMEIIEEAMAELTASYQTVPGWMSEAIDLLMLFC